MKKFFSLLMAAAITFSVVPAVVNAECSCKSKQSGQAVTTPVTQEVIKQVSVDQPLIKVDGKEVTFPSGSAYPYIAANRTMVPVRFVSEALGAKVDWDNTARTVNIDRGGKRIALKIGEKKATVAGKMITFDAAATIKDSRTFVPLRFISEAYGSQVVWDKINKVVYITTKLKVRDAYGTKLFKQFQASLKVKNGMLSGKMPIKTTENLSVHFEVGFNNGKQGIVLENGQSFSYPMAEVEGFYFSVYDREHGKRLGAYAFRSLPDLTPLDVTDL